MLAVASLAGGATYKDAGKAANVNESTVRRWERDDPQFVADLESAVDEHTATFKDRLTSEWFASLDTLVYLRDHANSPHVRIRAAIDILDRAGVRVLPEENDEPVKIVFDLNELDGM